MMQDRHAFIGGTPPVMAASGLDRGHTHTSRRLFDSHCHIIDHRFPIVANQGYTPPDFPLDAYLAQARPLGVVGGAVVSGSFQADDQTYLEDALPKLGAGWVGVTQIPNDYPDAEIAKLAALGVRAVRFNLVSRRASIASMTSWQWQPAFMRSPAGMPRCMSMPRRCSRMSPGWRNCRSSASTILA